jgi:uncharacterized protein (TIGR04255 family)
VGYAAVAVRFPESERVIYTTNPLVEVICQLRFPRILRIEADLPVSFQDLVRDGYPNLNEIPAPPLPSEVARAVGLDPGNIPSRTFQFADAENAWKIGLTSTFLALSTDRYVRWEDFRTRLKDALDVLDKTYEIRKFSRVGLRYRDLIVRSSVGLEGQPWTMFLRPQILGEIADDQFAQAVKQANRQLILELDYPNALVRFAHGLIQAQDDAGAVESCYLIDADFYTETGLERAGAENILDYFNKEAGRLFRWCITPTLSAAMGTIGQ